MSEGQWYSLPWWETGGKIRWTVTCAVGRASAVKRAIPIHPLNELLPKACYVRHSARGWEYTGWKALGSPSWKVKRSWENNVGGGAWSRQRGSEKACPPTPAPGSRICAEKVPNYLLITIETDMSHKSKEEDKFGILKYRILELEVRGSPTPAPRPSPVSTSHGTSDRLTCR